MKHRRVLSAVLYVLLVSLFVSPNVRYLAHERALLERETGLVTWTATEPHYIWKILAIPSFGLSACGYLFGWEYDWPTSAYLVTPVFMAMLFSPLAAYAASPSSLGKSWCRWVLLVHVACVVLFFVLSALVFYKCHEFV